MPTIHLAAPGKSEFLQCFERLCSFLEIKPGLYRNFSLGFFAVSKCDKASLLGFGQNKIPNFGIHAGSPPDSGKPTVWGMERQNTGTSSNDPQRDQKTQFPHGYAVESRQNHHELLPWAWAQQSKVSLAA